MKSLTRFLQRLKKTAIATSIGATLVAPAFAQNGGPTYNLLRFTENGTYYSLSNNATINNINTTVNANSNFTWVAFSYPVLIGTNTVFTNNIQSYATTNSNGINFPSPFNDVAIYADANSDVNPNSSLFLTMNVATNYNVFPSGQNNWFANNYGGTNFAYPFPNITLGSGATNIVTFTFQKSADGIYFDNANQFVLNYAPLAGGSTFSTNLPTSFLQGARRIRLISMVVSNVAANSTGVILNSVGIGAWHP